MEKSYGGGDLPQRLGAAAHDGISDIVVLLGKRTKAADILAEAIQNLIKAPASWSNAWCKNIQLFPNDFISPKKYFASFLSYNPYQLLSVSSEKTF
jgi:hypothetical protein